MGAMAPITNGREIAVATSSYIGVVKAWASFTTATQFQEGADDLALRLAFEKFQFEAWGRISGLEQNDFDERLFPLLDLIDGLLKKLKKLFSDGDQLQTRYGLADASRPMQRFKSIISGDTGLMSSKEPKVFEKLMANLQLSLHPSNGAFHVSDSLEAESIAETASIRTNFTKRFSSPKSRARWVLRDRSQFLHLLEAINLTVGQLGLLLSESQQRALSEEYVRTNIIVNGKIDNRQTLGLVRRAALTGHQDLAFCHMIERRGISDGLEFNEFSENSLMHRRMTSKALVNLSATDFYMPETTTSTRFLTSSKTWQGSIVLLERKDFPITADPADLEKLEARLQRLALLLSTQNGDLNTLRCFGYFRDPNQHCWWLAFEFPHRQKQSGTLQVASRLTASTRPVSLLRLLCNRTSKWRPALNDRLRLASKLASTLSALYSSGWMHKAVRSANVLFPYMYTRGKDRKPDLDGFEDISKPQLAGFEYSRQEQEGWDGIIYRHPNYQNTVATNGLLRPKPYRIHFDIYSFGLVLLEIALWVPLLDFLDANASDFLEDTDARLRPESKADVFSPDDARELQKRVMKVVRKELAFRVGREYRDAVKWCLTYADADELDSEHEVWHPALEFYNRVVVPLSHLAKLEEL